MSKGVARFERFISGFPAHRAGPVGAKYFSSFDDARSHQYCGLAAEAAEEPLHNRVVPKPCCGTGEPRRALPERRKVKPGSWSMR